MLLSAKNYFWLLLVLCIILLSLPIFIREKYSNGLLIGEDSYKSLRFGQEIKEKGLISYDNLSYGGKPFVEEKGWYFLLSIKSEFMAKFLPMILGVFSFILFYLLISGINKNLRGVASLLLIASPPFLYLFSTATKYAAAVFFILLGFYLISRKKAWFAYALFFISGFFSILTLFIAVIILLYNCLKGSKSKDFYFVFVSFILALLIQFYSLIWLGLPETLFSFSNFTFAKFFSFIIFSFGGKFGLGFFMLILALIGVYSVYSEKYKFLLAYVILFLLLFASFYLPFFLFYISFILAFFAAVGFILLFYASWKSDLFRFLTLIVIICGLLFSTLVFYDRVSSFEPTGDYFEAIEFLKDQEIDSFVLSDYRNGHYITYAGKKSFVDSNFLYAPNVMGRLETIDSLFNTTDIDIAVSILNDNNIKYVLVDSKMKKEIFNNRDEGFLFLLKYSPNRLVNIFNNSEVDIWYNRPPPLA